MIRLPKKIITVFCIFIFSFSIMFAEDDTPEPNSTETQTSESNESLNDNDDSSSTNTTSENNASQQTSDQPTETQTSESNESLNDNDNSSSTNTTSENNASQQTSDQPTSEEPTEEVSKEENINNDIQKPVEKIPEPDVIYEKGHLFQGGITEIVVNNNSSEFYVSGNDGFVTRYSYPNLTPDSWQLSSISIQKMALHPNQKYLAIYESNGLSDHRISLWNWKKKECFFTKKLSNSVVSLTWSAKGSYLFVGNTSVNGISVFNAEGEELNPFATPPGIVLLAATGETEKSVITYGETGRLVYTNLKEKKLPIQYSTESYLASPSLIRNFTQIIGYKDQNVYVIDSLSGKTLKTYEAKRPVFACRIRDKIPMWIDTGDEFRSWCIKQGNIKTPDFKLPNATKLIAARHVGNHIVVGTNTGQVFLLMQKSDSSVSVSAINIPVSNPILDMTTNGNLVFMLTSNKIYYLKSYEDSPKLLTSVRGVDKLLLYKKGLILWSTKEIAPIYYFSFETNKKTIIYRPKETVSSLSLYKNKLTITEFFAGVSIVDINTGMRDFYYAATGIQDAIQIDNTYMLITKSAIDKNKNPIFLINVKSSETLPFPIKGDFAFSLTRDDVIYNMLNCFVLTTNDDVSITELISITVDTTNPLSSKFKKIATYKTEDLNSFVISSENQVLTNLGNYSLMYHNKKTKKTASLMRTYTLTNKAAFMDQYILSLNADGSILWYDREYLNALSILTIDE